MEDPGGINPTTSGGNGYGTRLLPHLIIEEPVGSPAGSLVLLREEIGQGLVYGLHGLALCDVFLWEGRVCGWRDGSISVSNISKKNEVYLRMVIIYLYNKYYILTHIIQYFYLYEEGMRVYGFIFLIDI